jgi:hypothetical protein
LKKNNAQQITFHQSKTKVEDKMCVVVSRIRTEDIVFRVNLLIPLLLLVHSPERSIAA